MSRKLEHALYELHTMERTAQQSSPLHRVDARAKLLVALVLLFAALSMPLDHFSEILLFFTVPILCSTPNGIAYGGLFRRSLAVLPFLLLIGLFNPLYDRTPLFTIGQVVITRGWITFGSILLRGLLSVQILLLLIYTTGIYHLCRALQQLGLPAIITTQLLFVYRYLYVLLDESLRMTRARDARSFGRHAYPLRMWATIIGQLLIRTFNRAERIDRAMRSRGFTGQIPAGLSATHRWHTSDTLFVLCGTVLWVAIRLFYPVERLSTLFL